MAILYPTAQFNFHCCSVIYHYRNLCISGMVLSVTSSFTLQKRFSITINLSTIVIIDTHIVVQAHLLL